MGRYIGNAAHVLGDRPNVGVAAAPDAVLDGAGVAALVKRRGQSKPAMSAGRLADVVHTAHAASNRPFLRLMARLRGGRASSGCERAAFSPCGLCARSTQRMKSALRPNRMYVAVKVAVFSDSTEADPPVV